MIRRTYFFRLKTITVPAAIAANTTATGITIKIGFGGEFGDEGLEVIWEDEELLPVELDDERVGC